MRIRKAVSSRWLLVCPVMAIAVMCSLAAAFQKEPIVKLKWPDQSPTASDKTPFGLILNVWAPTRSYYQHADIWIEAKSKETGIVSLTIFDKTRGLPANVDFLTAEGGEELFTVRRMYPVPELFDKNPDPSLEKLDFLVAAQDSKGRKTKVGFSIELKKSH